MAFCLNERHETPCPLPCRACDEDGDEDCDEPSFYFTEGYSVSRHGTEWPEPAFFEPPPEASGWLREFNEWCRGYVAGLGHG